MPIIEVNHVTKEFRLGQFHSVKQTVRNAVARLRGISVAEHPPFKALDDVDFKVEQGEVLGIIGQNGAGKSTLLKLLAGIISPTRGSVAVNGRVAPLIEVGAGLVPDLTGRENIRLNATILGMKRAEIARKFDEIVAFAELEEFIDTPIKRYSSGMQVRLGFSIATSVESDALIVDEVLAVGDLAFQRKCFDRMEEMIKQHGKTVLLVSHNIRQVERLCTRAFLLDHGRIVLEGDPGDICEAFYSRANAKIAAQAQQASGPGRNMRTSGEIVLESLALLDQHGLETEVIISGKPLTIRGVFRSERVVPKSEVVYGFHTTDFVYIASMGTAHLEGTPDLAVGRNVVDCHIPHVPLVPGVFGIRVGVLDQNRREMFYGEALKIFSVEPGGLPVSKMAALGLVDVPAEWVFGSDAPSSDGFQ